MTYKPEINDYVRWKPHIEGWVYFKCDEYITIESNVRPKNSINYEACCLHRNERLLVICYSFQWKELTYIKSRESLYEEKNSLENVGESVG